MAESTRQGQTFSQKITGILTERPVILQIFRFVAIGFLNTGLSFIIANLVSKFFNVTQGNALGASSATGFLIATIQSYYWNKYWAFGQQTTKLWQNFLRLIIVGLLGVLALGFVYLGSKNTAPYLYYILLLVIFLIIEYIIWRSFQLTAGAAPANPVVSFAVVSVVGFLINYAIADKFSLAVHLTANGDLNKNLALVAATCVSLFWNFIGYKIFVFKR